METQVGTEHAKRTRTNTAKRHPSRPRKKLGKAMIIEACKKSSVAAVAAYMAALVGCAADVPEGEATNAKQLSPSTSNPWEAEYCEQQTQTEIRTYVEKNILPRLLEQDAPPLSITEAGDRMSLHIDLATIKGLEAWLRERNLFKTDTASSGEGSLRNKLVPLVQTAPIPEPMNQNLTAMEKAAAREEIIELLWQAPILSVIWLPHTEKFGKTLVALTVSPQLTGVTSGEESGATIEMQWTFDVDKDPESVAFEQISYFAPGEVYGKPCSSSQVEST